MSAAETLVVGLGQPLGGDDAVGLAIADHLRKHGIRALQVMDAPALVELLVVAERAILLDAVVGGGPPGTVVCLSDEDLAGRAVANPVSSHGLSVASAIALAKTLGACAEVCLIGVSIHPPEGLSTGLSAPVLAAVEPAAARVRELISAASPKPTPMPQGAGGSALRR